MNTKLRILLPGLALLLFTFAACDTNDRLPLKVLLAARTVSKLPLVVAYDQGLYEKYGLDIDLRLPDPRNDSEKPTHATHIFAQSWRRLKGIVGEPAWHPDIFVDGHTPNIVKYVERANFPHRIAIAGIDCYARAHIVAQTQFTSLEELKNRRIGISARKDTTTGFMSLLLAKRMGWDPVLDMSIKYDGRNVDDLDHDRVDAIIASETRYAKALKTNYPILADLREWDVALGGNSAMIEEGWLNDPKHREAALRFLRATVEGLAMFHEDRDLALDVIRRWYGISDPAEAKVIYKRGQWLERKPYPCYKGIDNTLEMYDSSELRKYKATDFYDDSLLLEIERSGFIDEIYSAYQKTR